MLGRQAQPLTTARFAAGRGENAGRFSPQGGRSGTACEGFSGDADFSMQVVDITGVFPAQFVIVLSR
jgi:hypothetical protein